MYGKNFIIFEEAVEGIKNGYYNEFAKMSHDGNVRAIIFYMNENKADIKEAAAYYGMDENFVKECIKNFVLDCDKLSNNTVNHESFSRRGR